MDLNLQTYHLRNVATLFRCQCLAFSIRSKKTLKEYERARVEFDAYRTDLEKMQLQSGPSEPPNHQAKLEESTKSFKARKERLDKLKERIKWIDGLIFS